MPEADRSEEYMEVLYVCSKEGKAVIGARLAEHMGVTPPPVTETLRRLAREGYVQPVAHGKRFSLRQQA